MDHRELGRAQAVVQRDRQRREAVGRHAAADVGRAGSGRSRRPSAALIAISQAVTALTRTSCRRRRSVSRAAGDRRGCVTVSVLLELGERVVEVVVDHDAVAIHAGLARPVACGSRPAPIPSPTSRARRSPQRSSGAAPAAIASSTDCGRSTTGTATAPDRRQRRDPLRLDAAADRDARDAGRRGPAGHAEGGLAEGGLGVDAALAGEDEVGAGELRGEARSPP